MPSSAKASQTRLILASASPRRRQILENLGVSFRVVIADVDETPHAGEAPRDLVVRLAREKATRIASSETLPVLGADTEVVLEGRVLGKPRSDEDAAEMLAGLQGRTHAVLTGVCLVAAGRTLTAIAQTDVTFGAMSRAEIDGYVATGEPRGKAGSYHIEGRGAAFIDHISGSPSNVAGLPAHVVRSLLQQAGLGGLDG